MDKSEHSTISLVTGGLSGCVEGQRGRDTSVQEGVTKTVLFHQCREVRACHARGIGSPAPLDLEYLQHLVAVVVDDLHGDLA
jgi:hypothetical protein